ncbi:hypothetical protein AB0K16_22470 [Nonomuraea jabiensis]|uniref:hypothetical protein n=1 Tax=Nonomuraea jabiensis TaxID=882448 RepID=UPI00343073FB
MGSWPDPVLAYGYYIGGKQAGWDINVSDEDDDYFSLTDIFWFDGDSSDFIWECEKRLQAAHAHPGVGFIPIGTHDDMRYILGIQHHPIVDGKLVAPSEVTVLQWTIDLTVALMTLDFKPIQKHAEWIHDACYC